MRIATWNVNSVKARMPRLLTWLQERQPDVVLMQETKSTEAAWPAAEFAALGYESAHYGDGRWNGVAALSRVGLDDVTRGLPGQPTFDGALESRALGVTAAGFRLWSLYVPNGRALDHPHYAYKLEFLAAVQRQAAAELRELPGDAAPFALLGDFNVAPTDQDVWDVAEFVGRTHVSVPERQALEQLAQGARSAETSLAELMPRASADVDDQRHPYTFWEHRMLGFPKGRGMRIDLVLANAAFRGRTGDVWVDRDARRGQGASDHAPVVVDLH